MVTNLSKRHTRALALALGPLYLALSCPCLITNDNLQSVMRQNTAGRFQSNKCSAQGDVIYLVCTNSQCCKNRSNRPINR